MYCSDVAGAFDRVSSERLLAKLEAKGIHPKLVKVISSWLEPRQASVVVGGRKSKAFLIKDMIFQGTVLGPQLWSLFFEDAKKGNQRVHVRVDRVRGRPERVQGGTRLDNSYQRHGISRSGSERTAPMGLG